MKRNFKEGLKNPVVFFEHYAESELENLQIKAAADMGALIFDGLCDGILLFNQGETISGKVVDATAFGILQAGRVRTSKTEYISCPGCGRTLFFGNVLFDALFLLVEADFASSGAHIAVVGVRHFSRTVDNASHDSYLESFQMAGGCLDTGNGTFQVVEGASAAGTRDVFGLAGTYTSGLQDTESSGIHYFAEEEAVEKLIELIKSNGDYAERT